MAKTLLIDVMADMKASSAERREMGPIAAKFVENLQRSNEQMVKLAAILTASDKEDLFDLLNENQEDK